MGVHPRPSPWTHLDPPVNLLSLGSCHLSALEGDRGTDAPPPPLFLNPAHQLRVSDVPPPLPSFAWRVARAPDTFQNALELCSLQCLLDLQTSPNLTWKIF